jgi:hypothetical protein
MTRSADTAELDYSANAFHPRAEQLFASCSSGGSFRCVSGGVEKIGKTASQSQFDERVARKRLFQLCFGSMAPSAVLAGPEALSPHTTLSSSNLSNGRTDRDFGERVARAAPNNRGHVRRTRTKEDTLTAAA